MSASVVQGWKCTSTICSGGTTSGAAGANVTSGNYVLVFVSTWSGGSNPTPTKSGTSTLSAFTQLYTHAYNSGSGILNQTVWIASVTGTGSLTIGITTTSDECGFAAVEVSGISGTLNVSSAGTGQYNSTTNTISTGAVTPAAGNIAFAMVSDWGTSVTWTVSSSTGGTFTVVPGAQISSNGCTSLTVAALTSTSAASTSCIFTQSVGASDTDNAILVVLSTSSAPASVLVPFAGSYNRHKTYKQPYRAAYLPLPQVQVAPVPPKTRRDHVLFAKAKTRVYRIMPTVAPTPAPLPVKYRRDHVHLAAHVSHGQKYLVPAPPTVVPPPREAVKPIRWLSAFRTVHRQTGISPPQTQGAPPFPPVSIRPARWLTGYLLRRGKTGVPAPAQVHYDPVEYWYQRPRWFTTMLRLVRYRTNIVPPQTQGPSTLPVTRIVNDHAATQNPHNPPDQSFEAWYRK